MPRNYTFAERALQLICAKAGVPYEEFEKMLEASYHITKMGEYRKSPESSYNMVRNSYKLHDGLTEDVCKAMFEHIKGPKSHFGKPPNCQ